MIVIPRSAIWSDRKLVYNSALFGVFVGCASLLCLFGCDLVVRRIAMLPPTASLGVVAISFLFGVPAFIMVTYRLQLLTGRRAILCGLGFGGGMACFTLFAAAFVLFLAEYRAATMLLAVAAMMVVLYVAIAPLVTMLIHMVAPSWRIQDGTLCPACGYCVLGCTTMRCPECGRDFDYADLETNESTFLERARRLGS